MKKYLAIYRTTLISDLQHIMDIILRFIAFIVIIFILVNLWRHLYVDPENVIEGYSMMQMVWYVIIAEMIWFGTRNKTLTTQISDDIKSGLIAYTANKPYSYIIYMIVRHFGEITIKAFSFFLLSIVIGFLFVGPLTTFTFSSIPLLMIVFFLSTLINSVLSITISLISFWIEDASPFHWLYDKLILIVGTLLPIELFPKVLQPVISATPIFVITYGPAKLAIAFDYALFWRVLGMQCLYLLVLVGLLTLMYRKGVRKLNVNGG